MVRLKNQKPIELGLRNVVRLEYVSLFTDLSTEMILGVLPFFIIKELGATAAILGIIEGLAETVQRAIIPDYASVQLKGTAYALYYSMIGIGSLIANSIFGILWTNIGYVAAFQYSIIMAIAGSIALIIFLTQKKRLIKTP